MAFSIVGIWNRIARPGFYALGSYLPEVDVQIRGFAARKGTREKALKKKRALKMKRAAQAAQDEKRKKISVVSASVKRTVDPPLPPIPNNFDVFLASLHKPKEYSIVEAIKCHRENLDRTILNVENAKIHILIELNMTAEKETKLINPWKSLLSYPHIFDTGFKKRVIVLCKEAFVQNAIEAGADLAGGIALIKQIKKGEIDLPAYDRIIGQLDFFDEISTLRSKLKLLMPKTQDGSLTVDFIKAIPIFKYGLEYACNLSASERTFAWITTYIGITTMEPEKVEENFIALLKDVNSRRPKRAGDFITCVHCTAPPSRENFRIDFSSYLNKINEKENSEENKNVNEETVSSAVAA